MASIKPVERGRVLLGGSFLLIVWLGACASRPPRLVPPPGAVDAVEGFGSAAIAGADASVKGRFGFVFRRPGLGRIEAVDPIGRTVFLLVLREGRAWFVLPGRKVFSEDAADVMMRRVLGVVLRPDEALRMLAGAWEAGTGEDGEDGWRVDRDGEGRVVRGASGDVAFTVRSFFPGDAVPREIGLSGPGTSGRIKVLKLGFNPPPRPALFEVAFLKNFQPKTWEEIRELLDR
jgi:outer membrane biogenesis lipoprotein LolB